MVLDTVRYVFWCEGGSRERWVAIKELIERVGLLVNQVDAFELRSLGIGSGTHGDD